MTNNIKGTRVTVPEFEIFSNPTVSIANITQRRFNLIDRAVDWTIKFDVLMTKSKDERDVKQVFVKFINKVRIRDHVKEKYPHLIEMLDKLLILK